MASIGIKWGQSSSKIAMATPNSSKQSHKIQSNLERIMLPNLSCKSLMCFISSTKLSLMSNSEAIYGKSERKYTCNIFFVKKLYVELKLRNDLKILTGRRNRNQFCNIQFVDVWHKMTSQLCDLNYSYLKPRYIRRSICM